MSAPEVAAVAERTAASASTQRGSRMRAVGTEAALAARLHGGKPAAFEPVTTNDLKRIMPNATDADIARYVEPLNHAMREFDINTPRRQQAFLAQVAHESGELQFNEEIASGAAYEGRRDLGNTKRGDGRRYKGRGLIQLTGRANYRDAGRALGVNLEGNPTQISKDPMLSARVAGWYWKDKGLNELADKQEFLLITKRINGGTNGLDDRRAHYRLAQTVIT